MSISLMIDLETLGHTATAAIASIGIIAFDPSGPELPPLDEMSEAGGKWYAKVNLQSCLSYGLTVDASTLAWWLRQEEAQRLEMASAIETGLELKAALVSMAKWMRSLSINRVWSHGASFDIPILEHAASRVGCSLPWHFKVVRDTRTLFDLAGIRYTSKSAGDKAHHALDDAYRQAVAVQRAFKKLRGGKDD
jgi:3' exoribonuclease, RNase T-like